jgi:antitoxin MazE
MEAVVKKWGNSLGFRIPKSIAQLTGVKNGSMVSINIEGESIVITPHKEEQTLEELLSNVTQDNIHEEISSGNQTGNEAW